MFEKFRSNSSKNYGLLCPSQYLSAADLSWDEKHKMAKINLEFIPNPEMYKFFEKVQGVEFLMFLIDIAKQIINI